MTDVRQETLNQEEKFKAKFNRSFSEGNDLTSIRCPICTEEIDGANIKDISNEFADHLVAKHHEEILDQTMIERNAELAETHVETEFSPGIIGTVTESDKRGILSPLSDARPFLAPKGDDIETSHSGIICPKCILHVQGDDDAELTNNLRRHWDSAHRGKGKSKTVWEDSPYSREASRNITPTRKVR